VDLPKYDFLVIGAGFFGCRVACFLQKHFNQSAIILEKSDKILQRASFVNQARVHNGYHYPRSVLTALRSAENFPIFTKEFKSCVVDDFEKIYAISAKNSKVTASQFEKFFKRIGAPIKKASKDRQKLFDKEMIEGVFETKEFAFDAKKLASIISQLIEDTKVSLKTGHEVISIEKEDDLFKIGFKTDTGEQSFLRSKYVFNCTYSNLNHILNSSGLDKIRLKHQFTELALVTPPKELKDIGVTVMDGPFFSFMPFPAEGLHSFSHVRYTPHTSWIDEDTSFDSSEILQKHQSESKFLSMAQDASRYMPLARHCEYKKSLFEIKTVLQSSEMNDSRPILFRKDSTHQNFYSILGAKIDNIYDIEKELAQQIF